MVTLQVSGYCRLALQGKIALNRRTIILIDVPVQQLFVLTTGTYSYWLIIVSVISYSGAAGNF